MYSPAVNNKQKEVMKFLKQVKNEDKQIQVRVKFPVNLKKKNPRETKHSVHSEYWVINR